MRKPKLKDGEFYLAMDYHYKGDKCHYEWHIKTDHPHFPHNIQAGLSSLFLAMGNVDSDCDIRSLKPVEIKC